MEVSWPLLKERIDKRHVKIAPGEEDTLYYDFIIPNNIETIKVFSWIGTQESGLGWGKTTIYDLKNGKEHLNETSKGISD